MSLTDLWEKSKSDNWFKKQYNIVKEVLVEISRLVNWFEAQSNVTKAVQLETSKLVNWLDGQFNPIKAVLFETSKLVNWFELHPKCSKAVFFETSKLVNWLDAQYNSVKAVFFETSKLVNWFFQQLSLFRLINASIPVISEIPLSLTSKWGISSASRVFIAPSPFVSIPKSISAFKKASSGMLTSDGGSRISHRVNDEVRAIRTNNTLRNAFTTVEARIQQVTSIHGTNQVF